MVYRQLFDRAGGDRVVRAGVIGAGQFATAIVTQSRDVSRLEVPVVADVNVEAGREAYRRTGFDAADIAVCENRSDALQALEQGRRVVVPDALLMMELPVEVVVEATGSPEAGALHGLEAIRHGKHVAMVNKETDVTVGPILNALAKREGVVYTAVDGDQHGLFMGLVAWARELGLEVLCGGKFRNTEAVFDPEAGAVSMGRQTATPDDAAIWGRIPPGRAAHFVRARRGLFAGQAHIGSSDGGEMAIAANATGLLPDVEALHCPVLRTAEIPEVMCPAEEGGILEQRGAIDAVTCLRHPYEAGLGGGVFMVVACENDYSRHILTTKGLVPNSRGSTALIYRPYHLCGVETAMSILTAGLLGVGTGATEFLPRVDLVGQATGALAAGETVGGKADSKLRALMRPAQAVTEGAPLPFYMATGALAADVPAGEVVTVDQVARPDDSTLWSLRAQQDETFLLD